MTKPASSVPIPVWRKIAMATWRPGKDPTISATMDIEAPRLLEYIDQVRKASSGVPQAVAEPTAQSMGGEGGAGRSEARYRVANDAPG